jgi:putative sporulation protein YtaF
MHIATILMFAIAVSLDGLGAGIAYGLKKIRLPLPSLVVIGLVTVLTMAFSIMAAGWLSKFISVHVAWFIGATLLICLGVWSILQEWGKQYLPDGNTWNGPIQPTEVRVDVGIFRLVIQVFKRPTEADMDHSGELSASEAVVLGLALALDALVAGFGAALAGGITLWTVFVVAIVQMAFITIGSKLAQEAIPAHLQKKFPFLPGGILILIGLLRFW